ncbi:MAG: hypothetical protein OCD02_03350 [Spirochaetaceae bacterium]
MKHINLIIISILIFLNISSIYSQSSTSFNSLNQTLSSNDKSESRISSGMLLWTDSPSSRAIYEELESHVNFLSMNIRNNSDLISYYNSREAYLENIGDTLNNIRDLILKRSNSFYGPDEWEIIDSEIFIHYSGILNELAWAQFNTIPMFGSWMENIDLKNRFKEGNFYTLKGIDRILQAVRSERSRIGAITNTLGFRGDRLATEEENTMSFQSSGDTDFAKELINMKRNEIMFFSNIFLLKQQK